MPCVINYIHCPYLFCLFVFFSLKIFRCFLDMLRGFHSFFFVFFHVVPLGIAYFTLSLASCSVTPILPTTSMILFCGGLPLFPPALQLHIQYLSIFFLLSNSGLQWSRSLSQLSYSERQCTP